MTYSHRNGETEPPTMGGWYWIDEWDDEDNEYWDEPDIFYIQDTVTKLMVHSFPGHNDSTPVGKIKARWWGPIESPIEQNSVYMTMDEWLEKERIRFSNGT